MKRLVTRPGGCQPDERLQPVEEGQEAGDSDARRADRGAVERGGGRGRSGARLDPGHPAVPARPNSWTQPGGNAAKSMGHLGLGSLTRPWPGGSASARAAASSERPPRRSPPRARSSSSTPRRWSGRSARRMAHPSGERRSAAVDIQSGTLFGGGVSSTMAASTRRTGRRRGRARRQDRRHVWRCARRAAARSTDDRQRQCLRVTQDNQLFALNPADGAIRWTGAGPFESPECSAPPRRPPRRATVVAGFSSGELTAYRYENGQVVWQDALARTSISTTVTSLSDIDAEPVIDGRVYAVGQGGRMVAIELITGQRVWEINFAGISTPWVAGDWIFVVTDDGQLLCLARTTASAVAHPAAALARREEEERADRLCRPGARRRAADARQFARPDRLRSPDRWPVQGTDERRCRCRCRRSSSTTGSTSFTRMASSPPGGDFPACGTGAKPVA